MKKFSYTYHYYMQSQLWYSIKNAYRLGRCCYSFKYPYFVDFSRIRKWNYTARYNLSKLLDITRRIE
jgi:hypothetical protein